MKISHLGTKPYLDIFEKMREHTRARDEHSEDEIWLVTHEPVFTQGQAGKPEHILSTSNIPIVQSDRGGQVTYHGPGQMMAYTLWDIKRLHLGVRDLVCVLEKSVIVLLGQYGIEATARRDAPGVYVDGAKICSLGLRIHKGRSYHGLCLNVDMDLGPFSYINPCGYAQMKMTQMKDFVPDIELEQVQMRWIDCVLAQLEQQQQINKDDKVIPCAI